MDIYKLPKPLYQKLSAELSPGEKTLWIGQPIPAKLAVSTIPFTLFAIPWTAFVLYWTVSAGFKYLDFKNPAFYFSLFGIPFVLIGIAMLFSPVFAYRSAEKTVCVITDRRAIIIRQLLRSFEIRSFRPDQLRNTSTIEDAKGNGSIIFEDIFDEKRRSRNKTGFFAAENIKQIKLLLDTLARKTTD